MLINKDPVIYSVIIIGSGPSGIFAAMELAAKINQPILLLEQVKRLHDTRNVSNGWMGGSAKSDLRLFTDPGFGGQICDTEATKTMLSYMESYCKGKIKKSKDTLSKKFIKKIQDHRITIIQPDTYIIGSDKLTQIENGFQNFLSNKITIKSNSRVDSIVKESKLFKVQVGDKAYFGKKCIVAMGRGGANWLINQAPNLNISYQNDNFDLGVRLEFPNSPIRDIVKTSCFRISFDEYRTTSISTKGIVEMENVDEFKTSNARSMTGKSTHYSSFGLLKNFKQPDALNKVLRLVQIANILADGQLLKEPVSKLLSDTSVLTPIEEYVSLKSGIQKIFTIMPEIASRCYLYAPEARLNAIKFDLSEHMETSIPGLYIAGDMSGQTKSFGQSACSGLIIARHIINLTK